MFLNLKVRDTGDKSKNRENLDCAVGKYSFPCVSGFCPVVERFENCLVKMTEEQRSFFGELFELRQALIGGRR